MAGIENTRKGQRAVLPDETTDMGPVGLDLGVPGLAEVLANLGLNGKTDLFSAIPCPTTPSQHERREEGIKGKPTVALIVGIAIHECHLDALIKQVAQDGEIPAKHKVTSLGESCVGISHDTTNQVGRDWLTVTCGV